MYKKIISMTLCFLLLLSVAPSNVLASPISNDNAYINNAYLNMLQDAFDDVVLNARVSRGLSDNFNDNQEVMLLELDSLLYPVYDVIDRIVYSINVDYLSNSYIFIRDVAHHYFFENIHLEIRTEGQFVFAILTYSVCLGTEPADEEFFRTGITPANNLFNRQRRGSQRIYDIHINVHSGTAHASGFYFIRDDGTVHINPSTNDFWRQINDTRLLRDIVSMGFSVHNNGTRTPHTGNTYRAYFQPSGWMQTSFRISW